ncbi:MAG: AsmA-like C-terminal region-containing protein, partial [Pyrinomonadaceae bacterium]|nr:AsmA-like C-terminal region-containing protein [Pyrinomonadaceae bacterium]
EHGTQLSGLLQADIFAKGTLSALEQQRGPFDAGGFLEIQNLYYRSRDFPQPVQKGNFKIQFQNSGGLPDATSITVSSGHVEVGSDPIDFTLNVNKHFSAIDLSGTAKGKLTLENIKQFVALEPGTSIKGLMEADISFSGSKADMDKKNYERIQTTGVVNVNNIQYVSKDYPEGVQVQTTQFRFTPQNVVLNHFDGHFKNTHFTANGVLNNIIGYALREEELEGTVNVTADKINLNEWMGRDTVTTPSTTASDPFLVPANFNITVHANAGAVHYDEVSYHNVRGSLVVKDETVRLQNVQTEALEGTIAFDGSYSTRQNKTKPDISLTYTIKDVNVQKAFYAYNTIQKLMPLGKFLSGKLTSQFSMAGKLNGDMFPDLGSLTGNGNLLLIQGVLSKFQPLDKLASALNVAVLKDVSLKDIKSHVEFANGKVLVKPFNVKVKDIDMQIGGMHGLDQELDYIIGMKVPRSYLGAGGNTLINNLTAQAQSKGIPVSVSDVIDLNIKIGGSINNPVIKTDLKAAVGDITKELKQQAIGFVQQKAEESKQTIKDSLTVVKNQVMNDVKSELTKQLIGNK